MQNRPRKGIKSFYEMPKPKPIATKYTHQHMNSSLEYTSNKMTDLIKNSGSPNHHSFTKGNNLTVDNPSNVHKKRSSIANELKRRLANISYSSPFSMKNSMMEC